MPLAAIFSGAVIQRWSSAYDMRGVLLFVKHGRHLESGTIVWILFSTLSPKILKVNIFMKRLVALGMQVLAAADGADF